MEERKVNPFEITITNVGIGLKCPKGITAADLLYLSFNSLLSLAMNMHDGEFCVCLQEAIQSSLNETAGVVQTEEAQKN